MFQKYRLHQTVAFRRYTDFVMVADPRSRRVFRMNADAGDVLNILEQGRDIKDDDTLAFIKVLEEQGLLAGGTARVPKPAASMSPGGGSASVVLDRFAGWAMDNLVPVSCQLELTWRCPLRCKHCYVDSSALKAADELGTEQWCALLDDLADMGCMYLSITGGEPFLRSDLRDIYDHARNRRFAVSLLTSGVGVDTDLLEHMISRGLDEAQVSLHGPNAAVHDSFTGVPGSFDAAWQTLLLLRNAGVSLRAAISVTRHNVDHIDALMTLLDDNGIAGNLNLLMAATRTGQGNEALQISDDELRRLTQRYISHRPGRLAELKPEDPVCGAGRNQMSIGPDGRVQPCLMWPLTVGDITASSVEDIWKNSRELQAVRNMTFKHLQDCPSCEYKNACNRCTALAVLEGREKENHSIVDCMQAQALYYSRKEGETS